MRERISKKNLASAMLAANITTIWYLAAASGVSINTISRSQNGGMVKLDTAGRIARALGVPVAEII